MKKISVTMSCCFCLDKYKTKIDVPDDWESDEIYQENSLCPKHVKIERFKSNCSGCVGGWTDCELWRAFAYNGCRNLTESDFKIMRKGLCPKRTNGTLMFSQEKGMEELDISKPGESESGIALEAAIKEYWKKYPDAK